MLSDDGRIDFTCRLLILVILSLYNESKAFFIFMEQVLCSEICNFNSRMHARLLTLMLEDSIWQNVKELFNKLFWILIMLIVQ